MLGARLGCIALLLGACLAASAQPAFTLDVGGLPAGTSVPRQQVWNRDGCHGGNVSPALSWSGAPSGTRSYALTLFDPDARNGRGWWHWVVWNIPADRNDLSAGVPPESPAPLRQARNDFGVLGYGGPCPPPGSVHHYVFTLYALPAARLDVPSAAGAAVIAAELRGKALAQASVSLRYERPRR